MAKIVDHVIQSRKEWCVLGCVILCTLALATLFTGCFTVCCYYYGVDVTVIGQVCAHGSVEPIKDAKLTFFDESRSGSYSKTLGVMGSTGHFQVPLEHRWGTRTTLAGLATGSWGARRKDRRFFLEFSKEGYATVRRPLSLDELDTYFIGLRMIRLEPAGNAE